MLLTDNTNAHRTIFSVQELNRFAKNQIESHFGLIWVEGEISDLGRPISGHIYFTLKDSKAQVRCAWFRGRQTQKSSQAIKNGSQVIVRARASLYEEKGEFQLIVEQIENAGFGALQQQFEALKQKLIAEGLFAPENRLPIPQLPKRIGVITSPTGAALRDVLSVLQRRCPMVPIMLYPTPVQGTGADQQIIQALQRAIVRNECETLIICRGGGSIEDLWAFNSEALARAIAACPIPVISGIGHDTDFTIVDFVADKRAPTPSAAAEIAVPDRLELAEQLDTLAQRLRQQLERKYQGLAQKLDWLDKRLEQQDPRKVLVANKQRVDNLQRRLQRSMQELRNYAEARLQQSMQKLSFCSPQKTVALHRRNIEYQRQLLNRGWQAIFNNQRLRLENAVRILDGVSPLRTLERGYAVIVDSSSHTNISNLQQVSTGQVVSALLKGGKIECEVKSIHHSDNISELLESQND